MNKPIWLALAAAAATASIGNAMDNAAKSPPMAPARDGDIAIQEELCAARKKGTVAAYDLFIARHPEHPLAATAREERERLRR
jgi:hypothetical protein